MSGTYYKETCGILTRKFLVKNREGSFKNTVQVEQNKKQNKFGIDIRKLYKTLPVGWCNILYCPSRRLVFSFFLKFSIESLESKPALSKILLYS